MTAMSLEKADKRHLLIAGSGRSGTTFLVEVLTACQMETELSRNPHAGYDAAAQAGLESDPLSTPDCPYVIKSPWAYQFVEQLLAGGRVRLDGAILPVRDLREAVTSRIALELGNLYARPGTTSLDAPWREFGTVPGGVTYSLEPLDQARILGHAFHTLIERLLDHDVPLCLIKFPRLVEDKDYLYRKLRPFLPEHIDERSFGEAFSRVADSRKIRVTQELRQDAQADHLPSLEEVERIALKRQVGLLHQRLARYDIISRSMRRMSQLLPLGKQLLSRRS
ncbi:conserved hypothetical protein [Methylorubrum extorquens CM4]|uniref:Sulfotransferase family protein n=2 Tax=Methylorubrum extorquens TaxID=408 RepID=B7KRM9_METC4|nr:conserved hypothetical protein [Methylorubrum extorquens CM4]